MTFAITYLLKNAAILQVLEDDKAGEQREIRHSDW